ncbi:hypothetical protein [Planktotalea sp.]|uniref:hypothetical protein n=1 Tax=Planktotalea sp. TaxID=2029877 RepID=UPI003F6AB20A
MLGKINISGINLNKSLFGNVLFDDFKANDEYYFLSSDKRSGIVFGQADNDVYPNSKCMPASQAESPKLFETWATELFIGQELESRTGSRYGNVGTIWQSTHFPQNLSSAAPFTTDILNKNLQKSSLASAHYQVSVTRLIPNY